MASKSHCEVPWVSRNHLGTPELDVFLRVEAKKLFFREKS